MNARMITEISMCAGLILAGALGYVGSLSLEASAYESIGPAFGPRWISIITIVLGAAVLVQVFIGGATSAPTATHVTRPWLAVFFIALTCAYAGLMNSGIAGFRIASILYLFVLGAALTDFRPRLLPIHGAIAVVLTLSCHYVFTQFMYVDLPDG